MKCPSMFDGKSAINFVRQLEGVKNAPNLTIDFSTLNYVYPFPTLIIAVKLREVITDRLSNGLETSAIGTNPASRAVSYLSHVGFFRLVLFPKGNYPNQASGSNTYLPITLISKHAIEEASQGQEIQIGVEKESERLARIIFPGDEGLYPVQMLSYCLREIIRNCFEHAGVNNCAAMAQRWFNGYAEIAIADRGVGILESLRNSYNIQTSKEAIEMALLPGITSQSINDPDSKWENSGFGLFVIAELGKRYGKFSLVSSNSILSAEKLKRQYEDIPLTGTIVRLRINVQEADYFTNILNQIVEEGETLAKTIPGAKKTASKMSKSLSLW